MAGLNDNLDKANKLLKQIAEKYKELGKENLFKNTDPEVIAKSETEIKKLEDALKGLTARVEDLNNSLSNTYNAWQSIVNESKGAKNAINQYNNILSSSASLSRQIRDHNLGTSMLSEKQLETLKQKLNSKKTDLKSSVNELATQRKALIEENKRQDVSFEQKKKNRLLVLDIGKKIELSNNALKKGEGLYDQELSRVKELQKHHKEINKELGFAPQLAAGLDNVLKKMGLPDLGVADALKEAKELGLEAKAQGKSFNTMAHFTGKMRKNFREAFTKANLLQGAVLGLIKAFGTSQKGIGDLAKGLGMSASRATVMRQEFGDIANLSGNANLTVKDIQQSQFAIGQALGTNAKLNNEDLETMTDIVKKTGLQHSELIGINKLSSATGKSLDDNVEAALGGATAFASQNKLVVDNNKVLREVNKASDALKLSLGGSVEALGEAVVKAQKFGINLEQAESIASSMLDFESSIEAELSAELLTGKNLNLERARQLALEGDIAAAAGEVLKQLEGSEEFNKMNVIQQEAMAKAVGLTREQLASSLIEREALAAMSEVEGETALEKYNTLVDEGKTQEEITKILGEKAAGQLEQQSAQEKFNASVEKLKEIFVQVMDAVAPIFDMLSSIAEVVLPAINFLLTPVFDMFKGISKIISGDLENLNGWEVAMGAIGAAALLYFGYTKSIAIYNGIIKGHKIAQIALERANKRGILGTIGSLVVQLGIQLGILSASLATNAALTFGIGVAIAVAAAAAGYAAIKALTADDMLSPGQGSSGYGKRTLFGPEGAIQLNNKDTVIAGTNLFGNDVKSEPGKATEMAGKGEIKVKSDGGGKVDMTQTNAKSDGGGKVDLTQTNALLQRLIETNAQLINVIRTEGIIELDGQKVGTALKLGSYQTQ